MKKRLGEKWLGGFRLLLLAAAVAVGAACESDDAKPRNTTAAMTGELIVLAAPRAGDAYSASTADAIFAFHVAYARRIEGRDRVLVLTDRATYPRYVAALGENRVALAPMADIWARDYGLANATRPLLFRYTAAGQGGGARGQRDADAVQDDLARLARAAGLHFSESGLRNDGDSRYATNGSESRY